MIFKKINIFLLGLIIFFLLSNSAQSYNIVVLENNDNIILKITDINPLYLKNEKRLSFSNADIYAAINPYSNLQAEALLIPIAIPESTLGDIKTNIIKENTINFDYQVNSINEYSISLQRINQIKNFKIAFLYIQPFKLINGKLSFINDIEIKVNFNKNIGISNKKSENYLRNYVVNKQHFDFLESKKENTYAKLNSPINSWYDSNKKYLEIKTKKDEIYFISIDSIKKYFPELNDKNNEYFHLINRGIEKYTKFSNEGMLFLGSRPKGDTTWYNSYTNYETFYLFYDESKKGLRYDDFTNVQSTKNIDFVQITKHFEEEKEYAIGYDYIQTRTCKGESWLWKVIEPYFNNSFNYPLDLNFYQNDPDSIKLEIAFSSVRINTTPGWFRGHHYSVEINDTKIDDKIVKDGESYLLSYNLPSKVLSKPQNQFYFKNTGVLDSTMVLATNDYIGIDYFNINAKVLPILTKDLKEFKIDNLIESSKLTISNFDGQKFVIDSINNRFIEINNSSSYIDLNLEANKEYYLFCTNKQEVGIPLLEIVKPTKYTNNLNKADYLIITDKTLLKSADSLVKINKLYNPMLNYFISDVDQIYKEFNYGNKSPHAIRDFIHYIISNWKNSTLKYIFIIGDANLDNRGVLEKSLMKDIVPSFGWPSSDYWYTTNADSATNIPELAIGRLPADDEQDVFNYIDKLKTFYNIKSHPWQKTFLMLSGSSGDQGELFRSYVQNAFSPMIVQPEFCADTVVISKSDDNATGESDGQKILKQLNEGKGLTIFLGHGSPTVFDMDGWNARLLNNKDKYGFLFTISCNSSAFSEANVISRNEEYVLEKDKGFISAAGSSFVTNVILGAELQINLSRFMSDTNLRLRNFVELINLAKYKLLGISSDFMIREAYAYQFTILGDPLLNLYPAKYSDLYFLKEFYNIKNSTNNTITEEDDYAKITGTLFNNGFKINDKFRIFAIRTYENKVDTFKFNLNEICFKNDFTFNIPIKNKSGIHKIKLIADPDNFCLEDNKLNNIIEFEFEVFKIALMAFDPLPYWNVNSSNPEFRVINPIKFDEKINYEFKIVKRTDSSEVFYESKLNEINIDSNYIEWKPNIFIYPQTSLMLKAKYITESGKSSGTLSIPFYTSNKTILDSVISKISSYEELKDLTTKNLTIVKDDISHIKLEYKPINVVLESSLFLYDTLNRYVQGRIAVDNKDIIWTIGPNHRPVGLNIVSLNAETGEIKNKKNFDSFFDDSSTIKFINFVKDSIDIDDIILFVSADRAFEVPINKVPKDSPGSLDSLVEFLSNLGSKNAKKIGYNTTLLFATCKNPKYKFFNERIDTTGNLVTLDTTFIFNKFLGQFETSYFGPSKKWLSSELGINYSQDSSQIDIEVIGINPLTSKEITLGKFSNKNFIDLRNIDSKVYKYLKIKGELSNQRHVSEDKMVKLSNITINFVPSNEVAIIKHLTYSDSQIFDRGDLTNYKTSIQNLSKRISSDTIDINIKVGDQLNEVENFRALIPLIKPNEIYNFSEQKYSDKYLSNYNQVDVIINDSTKVSEFYSFNNSFNYLIKLNDDTTKPWLELYADSIQIFNNSFVQIKPKLKILVYDNSKMPIKDIKNWGYRLNAKWKSLKSVNFNSMDRNIELKGVFELQLDSLDYGENFFSIYLLDGNGIRDTLNLVLNVSQNGLVEKLTNFPNPFNEITYFNFIYKAPVLDGKATIDIYDYNGKAVNKLNYDIKIGSNEMFWDGKDFYGDELPIGFYLYRISITNKEDIYIEPIFGKFMILR